jgi:DNA-directed RNA polymerase subunit M/transcription elongation factor TFIIS
VGFIVGAAETLGAARKHVQNVHVCPRCGKVVRGNGYGNHLRACEAVQSGQKRCGACGTTKPVTSFILTRQGPSWDCRDCRNAYKRRTQKPYPWSCHALNPKFRARHKLRAAIKRGIIVRPTVCPQCGVEGMVEAHHENYDEPYTVTWLCKSCHTAHHRKQRAA